MTGMYTMYVIERLRFSNITPSCCIKYCHYGHTDERILALTLISVLMLRIVYMLCCSLVCMPNDKLQIGISTSYFKRETI